MTKKVLYKSRGQEAIIMEIFDDEVVDNVIDITVYVDGGVLRLSNKAINKMIRDWFEKRAVYLPEYKGYTFHIDIEVHVTAKNYYKPFID